MERSYNLKSPAVKRLMREAQELKDATNEYSARPLDDNLFEWHFTFRGPEGSDFEGGFYHGRIILPPEYPMKPPSIMLLNPNGRFELNKKICLSISGYHPESWQPSWSIRTAILAIIGFMPTKGEGAIGALEYTPEERKVLARKSRSYSCHVCGNVCDLLAASSTPESLTKDKKDRELAKQILFAKPKASKTSQPESANLKDPALPDAENVNLHSAEAVVDLMPPEEPVGNSEGIRHRMTSAPSSETGTTTESARPAIQRSNDTTSLMLVVVLTIALALLVLRRLDRTYNFSSSLME